MSRITRSLVDDEHRGLSAPLAALLAAEVFHIAATVANDGQPTAHHAEFGPPAHVTAVLLTIGLLVWTRLRRPHARLLTALAGGAVVFAALIYHVIPVDSDFLNPFWDGGSTAQWVSVVAGLAAGIWCMVAGLRALRPASTVAPRTG